MTKTFNGDSNNWLKRVKQSINLLNSTVKVILSKHKRLRPTWKINKY